MSVALDTVLITAGTTANAESYPRVPRPRKGPSKITVRAAPRREPPLDDEARSLFLVGPNDRPLPFDAPDSLEGSGQMSDPTLATRERPADPFGHRPTSRSELSDPVAFSRRLLVGTLEAFAGHRSIAQLAPYLTRGVFTGLAKDAENPRITNRWRGNAAVRSVHLCEPADGVAEISAVIAVRGRSRAVALRLEGLDGRWRCVRLQLG